MKRLRRTLSALVLTSAPSLGCTEVHAHAPSKPPSIGEWTRARAALAELRASAPRAPYTATIAVTMREPRTGKSFDARGAVAVDPSRAMRMILVGPGGATALDAWVTRDAYRFAIPALGRVQRGASTPSARTGMPVGFFRWWFLAPVDGTLLTADASRGVFLLRARDATVHAAITSSGLRAARESGGVLEELTWTGHTLSPSAGDRAVYVHDATNLRVEVTIDAIGQEPPDPEAFVDPDALEPEKKAP